MSRIVFGVFLIAHALIHASWLTPKPEDPLYPFDLTRSRMLPGVPAGTLHAVGVVLVVITVIAFVLAGLGVLGVAGLAGLWRLTAVVGAIASLLTIAVFWHPWFVAGPVLDLAIVVAAYLNWP